MCVATDLNNKLAGGRIDKVFQPERDEIALLVRSAGANYRLLLSANPSHPRAHITQHTKDNPPHAPMFCMILRKYLSGGRVSCVSSIDYERIITVHVMSQDEMGDTTEKRLIVEVMGKHSNILLVNEKGKIIDAIKHIDADVNRIREIMPAREYTPPPGQNKLTPGECLPVDIIGAVLAIRDKEPSRLLDKALLDTIMGFSPLLCKELCHRAGLMHERQLGSLAPGDVISLDRQLCEMVELIERREFSPCLIYDSPDTKKGKLLDFHCLSIGVVGLASPAACINSALDAFYYERGMAEGLRQKKAHLLRLVNNNIDRCKKKLAILQENMREASNMDKYNLYGELLLANAHSVVSGSKGASVLNYYSVGHEYVDIPLNEDLSPQANAQVYYKKYRKAKSTMHNAGIQYKESLKELDYLESVLHELETSSTANEIDEVRQELAGQKYTSPPSAKKGNRQKAATPSHPDLFYSSDGLKIYVGKNNRQNDALTLKAASSNDIWLHVKNTPGSHVIIKKGQGAIPERTVYEGAMLAALYSKAKMSANVNVDYTTVNNVKKPPGAKPGMVVYENYRTMVVTPDGSFLTSLKKTE